ncbi:hypothetical protein RRG08_000268, partial [Elysia crispata]
FLHTSMTSKQVPRTAVLLAIVAVWLGLTLYAVNGAGVPNPDKYAHEKGEVARCGNQMSFGVALYRLNTSYKH